MGAFRTILEVQSHKWTLEVSTEQRKHWQILRNLMLCYTPQHSNYLYAVEIMYMYMYVNGSINFNRN